MRTHGGMTTIYGRWITVFMYSSRNSTLMKLDNSLVQIVNKIYACTVQYRRSSDCCAGLGTVLETGRTN